MIGQIINTLINVRESISPIFILFLIKDLIRLIPLNLEIFELLELEQKYPKK